MILNAPWRSLSSSYLRNLLPTLTSLSTPSPLSNLFPLAQKQPTNHRSLHNSTDPRETCILRLLNLCRGIEDLRPLKSLLIVYGLIDHESLIGEFLRRCFDLGAPDFALSVFGRIEKPTGLLQNLIVRCLCNDGLFEDVLFVYQNCQISGCPSDNFTFPFVIKACSALGAVQIGKGIHCSLLRAGFGDNLIVQTALVDFYAKCGQMETARLVFDRMSQPDLVSWNALISGYSSNELNNEVFGVFRKIWAMGLKPNVSTLASIIPVCTRLGCWHAGKSLHGSALKSGCSVDESLTPALILMYAGGEDLHIARRLFDCLLEKSITIWNSMISAYTQNRKPMEAFSMFKKMLQADVQPNTITFLSIIPSCEDFDCILCGESLHACVVKDGLVDQLPVMTALLSMYAKLGDMGSAEFLFHQMPERNLLSWNSFVSAYVHHKYWVSSFAAFREMQFTGFNPDAVSIVCILSACSELKTTLLGKSAHAYSLKKGFDVKLNVSNALLLFYSSCCQLSTSFNLFHKMAIRNAISWNTLISGCAHNGEARYAVALVDQMQQVGMDLDLVTLISILPCYTGFEELVQGKAIHGHAIKMGFASDVSLSNALISMYFNCGEFDSGKLIFERMLNRNVVSWNALITGYRNHNLQYDAMRSFSRMVKQGQKPNYITLLNILPVCYTPLQGKSIHAFVARKEIVVEASLLTSLISMYARFGFMIYCLTLFEMGDKRNISLWNAIISTHVQAKNAKNAVAFFSQLLGTETEPDYMTILSLISACIQIHNLNLSKSIMAYVIHMGFDRDVAVSNALIDLYARCGNISIARKLFEGSLEKDAISWSVMINGHGLHGDGEAALALFSEMKLSGMKPDDVTYVSILSACSHAGFVEQGQMFFNSMVENGILPRMEHYACMVDLLGRTGHLNEAYDIVKKFPHKPSVSLLESLLGACITHGNLKLGEKIGRLLLEMDPENPGSYAMLYNAYAAAGRWTDADKVRSKMEGRQLRKVPAFSLVEAS
ncbi:pentatricopeptide repeat-containing protein At5g39350-like [Actinidia eriantha]|uniref:pentatricopeptide repeat-containing protein At5g39350-like n=1 Tax=Actinidia eriantha TaxID=165200 RepID=UPI00258603AD|nr:pentatricopeptide repeat-containing protein At5g39350-like [Actinidia eriantha]